MKTPNQATESWTKFTEDCGPTRGSDNLPSAQNDQMQAMHVTTRQRLTIILVFQVRLS